MYKKHIGTSGLLDWIENEKFGNIEDAQTRLEYLIVASGGNFHKEEK